MRHISHEDSVKRPAFQWYPGDWRRDTALQSCSIEARGLWLEMLNLMHDGEPYGHLTAGGVPITSDMLGTLTGVPVARARRLVKELESRRIFSRTDADVIYSRRMVRDEHLRNVRAAGGPKSLDNPNVPRPKDGTKDPNKDTGKDTLPASIGGSPAVAVASAVALASTTTSASAREELLRLVPHRASWEAEMNAALQGMHGPILTPQQLDRAIGDYLGNGAVKAPSLRQFRAYLTDAARPPAVAANGMTNDPTIAALEKWKRDTDAREQSSKSA